MHVEVCTTASAAWAVRCHLTTGTSPTSTPLRAACAGRALRGVHRGPRRPRRQRLTRTNIRLTAHRRPEPLRVLFCHAMRLQTDERRLADMVQLIHPPAHDETAEARAPSQVCKSLSQTSCQHFSPRRLCTSTSSNVRQVSARSRSTHVNARRTS